MMRRKVTNGVRLPRVAGKRQRLAAAAAIIDRLARAGAARLPHPILPPERIESGRIGPDVLD